MQALNHVDMYHSELGKPEGLQLPVVEVLVSQCWLCLQCSLVQCATWLKAWQGSPLEHGNSALRGSHWPSAGVAEALQDAEEPARNPRQGERRSICSAAGALRRHRQRTAGAQMTTSGTFTVSMCCLALA